MIEGSYSRGIIDSKNARVFDRGSLCAFVLYLALSVGFLGRGLLFNSSTYYIGCGPDPSAFIWSITWWRYAISHHLNPLLSRVVFVPGGVNLAWMTTIPLAGVLIWPVTAAFGPLVAYNCLALAAPVLTAWATFFLCRHLTRSFWPALVAGYLFGFSAYMLAQINGGHLNLVFVFLSPLALYLVARWLEGTIVSWKMVLLTGLTLTAQFLLSIEIFATMAVFAGLALLLALGATEGGTRSRLVKLLGVLACAYGMALIIVSPYLYYLFARGEAHGAIWDTLQFSADALNYLIPTEANALGTLVPLRKIATTFTGNDFERTAYVGPILIGVMWVYARHHWKEPFGKVLVNSLVVICVLSFGPTLHFGGRELVGMPGKLLAITPAIEQALPVRFTMYAMLVVAIIVALWLADSTAKLRTKLVVAALIVVFSIPNLDSKHWATKLDAPAFFTSGLYKQYLSRDENVLVTPYWILGNSMLWQAQTGMYFRMAGGYTGPLPNEYKRWPFVSALAEWTLLPNPQMQMMSFLANHDVGAVIVSNDDPDRILWQRWLPKEMVPLEIGGVTYYRIPPSALQRYKAISALEAERKADLELFDGLIEASTKYSAGGRRPELLTPFTLETLGLIPSDWMPGPVWSPGWLAGTKFDATLDFDKPFYRGVWAGYVGGKFLGIGVKGTYEGVRPAIERYRSDAYRIYFPFPKKLTDGVRDDERGLLLMFFDKDGLGRVITKRKDIVPGQPGGIGRGANPPASPHN
jgi:type IV secretory pathway VirB2 component (pilin)